MISASVEVDFFLLEGEKHQQHFDGANRVALILPEVKVTAREKQNVNIVHRRFSAGFLLLSHRSTNKENRPRINHSTGGFSTRESRKIHRRAAIFSRYTAARREFASTSEPQRGSFVSHPRLVNETDVEKILLRTASVCVRAYVMQLIRARESRRGI